MSRRVDVLISSILDWNAPAFAITVWTNHWAAAAVSARGRHHSSSCKGRERFCRAIERGIVDWWMWTEA